MNGGDNMRENLKKARNEAGMTQQQIADEKNGGSGLVRKGMFHEQSKIKRSSEKSRIIQMAIIAVAIFAIISFMRS